MVSFQSIGGIAPLLNCSVVISIVRNFIVHVKQTYSQWHGEYLGVLSLSCSYAVHMSPEWPETDRR